MRPYPSTGRLRAAPAGAVSHLPDYLAQLEQLPAGSLVPVHGLIAETIEGMYSTSDENKFLEVTYAKGEREIFYFKDFASGAMIENIVARAKKKAKR